MARAVRNWLILTVAGCALVALASLLPGERVGDGIGRFPVFGGNDRRETTAEMRVRRAHDELYRLELRDTLRSILAARPSGADAVIWIDPALAGVLPDSAVEAIEVAVASLSERSLRLPVLVALALDSVPPREGVPWTGIDEVIHFLPAAADGGSCLAVLSVKRKRRVPFRLWSTIFYRVDGTRERAAALLGPCAYYAVFGRPGPEVEGWLETTRFETALSPPALTGAETELELSRPEALLSLARVWQPERELVACAAGNAAACRAAVLTGGSAAWRAPGGSSALGPGVIARSFYYSFSPLGPNAHRWLSDVLADVGPERFGEFWSSQAPVDSAFAVATGTSLDRWTMDWARAQLGEPRLGPAAPLSASVLALIVAGGFGVGVLTWVQRRQVR